MKLTKAAAERIRDLIIEENEPKLKGLRVALRGGGCNGFEYVFTFEDTIDEGDFVFEATDVKLIVDYMSMEYLNEATLDYVEKPFESRFVISNPNIKSSCGCGSSVGF
jgi:iron-sulfur cluster insertion protein|tara:strand:+ start:1980 stop:2303 length:324 start_codon:yes stop_codon:yes gene_type:complete